MYCKANFWLEIYFSQGPFRVLFPSWSGNCQSFSSSFFRNSAWVWPFLPLSLPSHPLLNCKREREHPTRALPSIFIFPSTFVFWLGVGFELFFVTKIKMGGGTGGRKAQNFHRIPISPPLPPLSFEAGNKSDEYKSVFFFASPTKSFFSPLPPSAFPSPSVFPYISSRAARVFFKKKKEI